MESWCQRGDTGDIRSLRTRGGIVNFSYRIALGAVVLAATLAFSAQLALALPPPGDDPPLRCPPGYHKEDDVCVKNPTAPPENSPVVSFDLARQTTDRAGIRVTGKASDA